MYGVQLIDVCKSFKTNNQQEFVVVDKINLKIAGGEFFSLLGSSGCGKTTTLRMIAGLEMPTSGEIYIDNQPMGKSPPFHRQVNTVFQNYALFPHMTIADNIAFGLQMEKLPTSQIRDRVADVIALVKLTGLEKRYPRQLSGGQQQRVALARSLVKQPKVLLLDEPLGALDLKLRQQMQFELKQLQQQLKITFIYVTHDQEEALTMSDRLAVMDQGQVLQVGTPREIYEEPNSLFIADFIGETNFLSGRVVEKQGNKLTVLVDESLPISLSSEDDLPIGKIVTLVIRPEKIAIHPQNFTAESCLLATVEDLIYLGTDTRYLVRLNKNTSLTIRQQNFDNSYLSQYQVGEEVQIRLPVQNITLIY